MNICGNIHRNVPVESPTKERPIQEKFKFEKTQDGQF